jgi:hypothetical protein
VTWKRRGASGTHSSSLFGVLEGALPSNADRLRIEVNVDLNTSPLRLHEEGDFIRSVLADKLATLSVVEESGDFDPALVNIVGPAGSTGGHHGLELPSWSRGRLLNKALFYDATNHSFSLYLRRFTAFAVSGSSVWMHIQRNPGDDVCLRGGFE